MNADTRAVKILARRSEGRSLEAIGTEFGLSRERVRQIVAAHNGPSAASLKADRLAAYGQRAYGLRATRISWTRVGRALGIDPFTAQQAANIYAAQLGTVPTEEVRRDPVVTAKQQRAYEMRLSGMAWPAISAALGYDCPSNPAHAACSMAATYARREGKPWPIDCPKRTGRPPDPRCEQAYTLRREGHPWTVIEHRLGWAGGVRANNACNAAWRHAIRHNLPWPITTEAP